MSKYTLLLFIFLLAFANSQSCFRCKPGKCNQKNQCDQCEDGFMLTSQSWCGLFTPIEKCRKYDVLNTSRCFQCHRDRDLNDGRCITRPENCQSADIFKQCIRCQQGFQLYEGNCYSKNVNNCPLGFLPYLGFCRPFPNKNQNSTKCKDEFLNGVCLQKTSKTPCQGSCQCQEGLKYNNFCYQIKLNKCTLLRNPLYCQACQEGFIAINGGCLQPIKVDDPNCNVKNKDYCTGCNKGYLLNQDLFCAKNYNIRCPIQSGYFYERNGGCFYIDIRCQAVNLTSSRYQCLRCPSGFTLKDGLCQRNICVEFQDNICQRVFLGYKIVGINQYIKLPTNCLEVNDEYQCIKCSQFTERTLINTLQAESKKNRHVCAYTDRNCLAYNLNGSCIKCLDQNKEGGYILKNRFCYKIAQNCEKRIDQDLSKCQKCNQGYHLDETDSLCYINKPGCERYLSKSDCKQCNSSLNYILYKTQCYLLDSQCIDYDENFLCRRCLNGYLPFRNTCVFYHPYCLQYGNDRVCVKAAAGWSLGSGMTEAQKTYYRRFVIRGGQVRSRSENIPANSLPKDLGQGAGQYLQGAIISRLPFSNLNHVRINSVNMFGQITSCRNGFTLNSNLCLSRSQNIQTYKPTIQNCLRQNGSNKCLDCKQPYKNLDGLCIIQIEKCKDYGFSRGHTPGICQQCQDNRTYWFGQCRTLTCSSTNNKLCQSCLANFTYGFGFCQPNILPNCKIFLNDNCQVCLPGYFVTAQNQCQQQIKDCLNTNKDTGRCLQCKYSFTLYREKCVKQTQKCMDYDQNAQCIRCQQNQVNLVQLMKDKTCITVEGQCSLISETTKKCSSCILGYTLKEQTNLCVMQRSNCSNYDVRGRCTKCFRPFALIRNQCQLFIPFCLNYTADNKKCNLCYTGSQLDQGCCRLPDRACSSFNYNQCICQSCNLTYFLNIMGVCQKNPVGCDVFNFTTSGCIKCTENYYLTSDGKCRASQEMQNGCLNISKIVKGDSISFQCINCELTFELKNSNSLCYGFNCKAWDPTYRFCTECPRYYKISRKSPLEQKLAYCIPYFCETYNPGENQCSKNISIYKGGHQIIVQSRTVRIKYCTNVLDNGKCSACENYRYPSNKTLFNLCYPLHCKNQDEFNCQQCQFGYELHPSKSGTCVAMNCKSYKPNGSCEVCNQPFTLSSNYICENKGCCDIYDQAKNICSRPKKYFTIDNSVCAPNNCLRRDLTKMTSCLTCIFGYTLFPDGTCRINNCEQQSTLGDFCITCKKGYKPEASPKNPGKFICAFRYCKVWSDDYNFCLQCPQGFTLNKDKMCEASYCEVFQNSGVCRNCVKYYILGQDERCVANCSLGTSDKCQCCKLGSSLNSTSGLCQPSQSFCSTFNQRTGSCIKCMDNYALISGKCILPPPNCRIPSLLGCESCSIGYELRNNCQCVPKFCKLWDESGKCTTCHPRFEKTSQGLCKTRDCQFFSNQLWACNGCYNGFRYVDNTCITNNCRIWQDPQNTTCKQCQRSLIIEPSFSRQPSFTYQLVQGACYIRYCQRDPRQLFCKSCYPGYKLVSNGLCVCENYDFTKKLCICPSGYLYNQQTTLCSLDRNPCLLRSDRNVCVQCPVAYQQPAINNGSCIPLYCNKWRQNSPGQFFCQQCAPNFKIVNGGFCQSILCRRLQNVTGFALPQCRQCADGYFTFSSLCIPLHCDRLTYDIKNGICKKCVDLGYQLSQNQTRCIVSNCQIQLFPDKCRKCKFGYQNFSDICIARNCTVYDETKCKECISGFYLKDQVCFASNCEVYGEQNLCIKCSDGFIISENFTCIRRNCEIDSLPRCLQCYLGYFVNPSLQSCVPVNCKKYQQNFTKCQVCNDGFFKQNGTCIDIRCEINGFDRQYNCNRCQQGFQLNKNKLCYPKDISVCPQGRYYSNQAKGCVNITQPGCLFYNPSNNACIWCAENFFLYNNLCYSVRYCTSFSYYFGCYQCIQGYYLQNRVCVEQILDPNCNKANGKRCLICNDGFTLIANKCIKNPRNCMSVNSEAICQKCDDGYIFKGVICESIDQNCIQFLSNKCRRCNPDFYINRIGLCSRNPQNCIESNMNGICIRCNLGFQFINNACVRKVVACLRYDQRSQNCIQCFENFTLSSNECICPRGSQLINQQLCMKLPDNCASISPANFLCSQCRSPFLLRSDFKCAVPEAPENCQIYDPQTGECKKCFNSFILLSNLCVKCPNNQIQVQNKCFNKRIGCQDYGTNGQCLKCIIGFELKGEICQSQVQIPQFCIRHLYQGSNVKCLECDSRYNLSPDSRNCILKNCIQMDLSRRVCVRCISPFQWNGQMCIFTTDFCLFYSNGYCSNCSDWSRLDRNRCVPNNCSNYNYQLGACQSCSNGFNLNLFNKRCFMIIPFCLEYSNTGLCLRCTTLYSVSNNGLSCSAGAVPNCYFQSGTSCGRCRHRFYVDSNSCSAYIPYCTNIDPQGKCISCCFGSTLRNGICVKDDSIKYCLNQVGNRCQKCMQNYYYCNFCDACLPASPNCNKYNNLGQCVQCVGQFSLANGVCISLPVGIMSGTTATCRFGYYMKDNNCYRNQNDLQLYSRKGSVTISPLGDYFSITKQGDALIIFSIIINIRGTVSNDASFFLYYKSKNSDPFICWNSCIPTKIDSQAYTKDLVHPIIAKQIRVYLTSQNLRSADLDLKILD